MTQPGVGYAVKRGEDIAIKNKYRLEDYYLFMPVPGSLLLSNDLYSNSSEIKPKYYDDQSDDE